MLRPQQAGTTLLRSLHRYFLTASPKAWKRVAPGGTMARKHCACPNQRTARRSESQRRRLPIAGGMKKHLTCHLSATRRRMCWKTGLRAKKMHSALPKLPCAMGRIMDTANDSTQSCTATVGDQSQQLDEGATAIMLRRLPSKLTIESLLDILSQFWPSRYNFVYVPHDKSRARNVALAFINFTDSETVRMAYDYFQGRSHPMDVRLGSHIRVSQADVQGLSLNLAYFVARSGFADMDNPHAPRVFENGWRVNLLEAVQKHVTMELMAQAEPAPAPPEAEAIERSAGKRGYREGGCVGPTAATDKAERLKSFKENRDVFSKHSNGFAGQQSDLKSRVSRREAEALLQRLTAGPALGQDLDEVRRLRKLVDDRSA
ncbi:ML3 [Symbiodinium necroappetens]|uniref:ML3 protein n=1 Tax=Symbiodinium necroappetens TaxID=1628268 RepID=A0A812LZV5_9DINO|nr:ML3 [Symbiodinium necroappetens]